MAIEYRKNASRETLLGLVEQYGIEVNPDVGRVELIAALDAYNLAEGLEQSTRNPLEDDTPQVQTDSENAPEGGPLPGDTEIPPQTEKPSEGTQSPPEDASGYTLFAYAGPSLPKGRLKENTVFRGTLGDVKAYLADILEEYPQVEKLLVPTHKLGVFAAKVRTPGNILHQYYNDIISAMRKNKEV